MPMFERLKTKWGVNNLSLVLILTTFALGGSLCGYLAKIILTWIGLHSGSQKIIVYIVLVTLLWPLCVIALSLVTGQFVFFRTYLKRIWNKMTGNKKYD